MERSVAASKLESYRLLVDALRRAGYRVTWDEVLENGGAPVPETAVQKKMIFELLQRKGYFPSWRDAKLMVKQTPAFSIPRRKPKAADVIRHVWATGGVSILAHPNLMAEQVRTEDGAEITRDAFIKQLLQCGLDGVEIRYPYDKTSYGGSHTREELARSNYLKYVGRVRILSGGSDYHAEAKKGTGTPRLLGESGLTLTEFRTNPHLLTLIER